MSDQESEMTIAKPAYYQDKADHYFKEGNKSKTGQAIPVPMRLFRKHIQSYWDAKQLYYLDKWLNKRPSELEAATTSNNMTAAELIIVRFVHVCMEKPHPALFKMVMEMSGGKKMLGELPQEEEREAGKTVRRIILEMPKSKRINESESN